MFDSRLALRLSDDGRAVVAIAGLHAGAVSPEMVHALIDREGFGDFCILESDILDFCRQAASGSGPVTALVAERRDGEVIVTVTGAGEAAYLTLVPPFGGKPHSRADIVAALDKAGIKAGILQEVIDRAGRLIKADKILIAQALPGVPGEGTRFVPLVESGSFVACDTPLMRRMPPTNGTPGEAVTGQPMAPLPGLNREWGQLSGTAESPTNPNLLIAVQDGMVRFSEDGAVIAASCHIEVALSPDGFGAFISFAPNPGGRPPTQAQLERALFRHGVLAGILPEAMAQATTLPATHRFLIAQAQMPQPGHSSGYVPLVPAETWVESGTPIMRRLPPTPGKPGFQITGEPIAAPPPPPPSPFDFGDGTSIDARQPDLLRASHAGKVRFGERGAMVVRACHVAVQIAPDGLVAYLTLREGTGEVERQRPIIDTTLAEAGITTGILADALAEAAASSQVAGLLVARGTKAQPGRPGRIELLIDPQIRFVEAGTPLIRLIPTEVGTAGITVTGLELAAPTLEDSLALLQRPGTMPHPADANTLIAAAGGHVMIGENWVEVGGIRQIDKVTASTPIDSDESVVVTGSVEAGGQIRSRGDVVVMGDVTSARIEADGSIEILGLITGNAQVRAKGPVKVGEIRDAQVDSDAGITVHTGIRRGNVNAAGPIEVTHGAIAGGRVSSLSGITAAVIGSPDGEPTTIDVGPSPAWQTKLNTVKLARQDLEGKITETSRSLIHLKVKGRDHAHPNTMRLLEVQRAKLVDEAKVLDVNQERLLEKLTSKGPGQVVAKELVHPGVKLTFSSLAQSLHLVRVVEADVPGAVFSVRGGQIIAVPSVQHTIRPSELPVNQGRLPSQP